MGIQGLSWTTLFHWSQLTEKDLDPWEAESLFKASLAYAVTWNEAKKPGCPSPWAEVRVDALAIQNQIKAMFRSMITTQKKKGARK